MGKIIAFINQKGGVGKTTSAINIAAIYSQLLGKKVLLVDMDPQGNASTGLGIYPDKITKTIYDALIEPNFSVKDAIYKTYINNLDLIPSNSGLSAAEAKLNAMVAGGQFKLQGVLSKVKQEYDLILIDCPPSMGYLSVNALTAADECIIPLQAELYSIQGVANLQETITAIQTYTNQKLVLRGLLITLFDSRTKIHQENEQNLRNHFQEKVFKTNIPKNIKLAACVNDGRAIITDGMNSPGAQAYLKLVQELEGELNSPINQLIKSNIKEENNE